MPRIPFAPVLVALVAGCASPGESPAMQIPKAFQGEPVVVHLDLGGVT